MSLWLFPEAQHGDGHLGLLNNTPLHNRPCPMMVWSRGATQHEAPPVLALTAAPGLGLGIR